MHLTWDLLQDRTGQVALFCARLSNDEKTISANATIIWPHVDRELLFAMTCPEFKAIIKLPASTPIGSMFIKETGDFPLEFPVISLQRYESLAHYLGENLEGKLRHKVNARKAVQTPVDWNSILES